MNPAEDVITLEPLAEHHDQVEAVAGAAAHSEALEVLRPEGWDQPLERRIRNPHTTRPTADAWHASPSGAAAKGSPHRPGSRRRSSATTGPSSKTTRR